MAGSILLEPPPPPDPFGDPFGDFNPNNDGDWREETAIRSPSRISLGPTRSHATLTGLVPFNKWKQAVRWFLGFQYVVLDGDTYYLRRSRPARHPIYAGLYASGLVEAVACDFPHAWNYFDNADLAHGVYNQVRLTFAFTQREYQVLGDGDVASEIERWVSIRPRPYVETLTVEGGEFLFVDPAGPPPAGINEVIVPGHRFTLRAEKTSFEVTWHQVPFTWVAQNDGYMPKITTYQGKVNSATFMSMPAGTVLLDDVDVDMYSDPITADLSGDWIGKTSTLKFMFKFFDPPQGIPDHADRGWLLMPSATNGLWYPVTRRSGAIPLYRSEDFYKLFTHHSAV